MTNVGAEPRRSRPSGKGDPEGNVFTRFFSSLGLFISQVLDELRKVVRPTRSELINYTAVVVVFVVLIMVIISIFDFAFTRLAGWMFG